VCCHLANIIDIDNMKILTRQLSAVPDVTMSRSLSPFVKLLWPFCVGSKLLLYDDSSAEICTKLHHFVLSVKNFFGTPQPLLRPLTQWGDNRSTARRTFVAFKIGPRFFAPKWRFWGSANQTESFKYLPARQLSLYEISPRFLHQIEGFRGQPI